MATMLDIQNLKDYAAAYEAAVHCDYCPSPDEAAGLVDEIETDFHADNFRRGAKKMEGRRPDQIADRIVAMIVDLNY